jgi:hypothetical protein
MTLVWFSESAGPVELASGIDALYLSGMGEAPAVLLDELQAVKSAAVEAGSPVDWHLGGYPVRVLGSGWGKYRYCLVHEMGRIGVTPSKSLPVVRVQPTSLALHSYGPSMTVLWARNLLDAAGIEARLQVAWLDLHADWQGLWIEAEERSKFVTRSDHRALYEVAEDLSGLNFGSRGGALYARIYDKTLELEHKGDDWWLEVWGDAFDSEQRVLRTEFEFSRDGLRQFGLSSPEDVFEQVGPLWAYATCQWLSLRVPSDDETRSRWPVDRRWLAVQRASLAGASLPAVRLRAGESAGSLRKMLPAVVGYLSSVAVPLGTVDLDDTLDALRPHVLRYGYESGIDFATRVEEKRRAS